MTSSQAVTVMYVWRELNAYFLREGNATPEGFTEYLMSALEVDRDEPVGMDREDEF